MNRRFKLTFDTLGTFLASHGRQIGRGVNTSPAEERARFEQNMHMSPRRRHRTDSADGGDELCLLHKLLSVCLSCLASVDAQDSMMFRNPRHVIARFRIAIAPCGF